MNEKRRLGIALGGGGARGFAHLGVLLALQDAQIPISSIAGTSIGAAMGACRAIDHPLNTTADLLSLLDLNDLLQVSDSTIREVQRALGRGMVEFVRGCDWTD
ncbi:patatin-like phospholipase family protein, partial [Candidatus Bipolaricaulota bacterium]|nr:patatin-like phospholipase family protein [Candidatus Bipolaricaulota bacterium]